MDNGEYPQFKADPLGYWSRAEQLVRVGENPALAPKANIVRGQRANGEVNQTVYLKKDTGELALVDNVTGEILSLYRPGFGPNRPLKIEVKEAIKFYNNMVLPEFRI